MSLSGLAVASALRASVSSPPKDSVVCVCVCLRRFARLAAAVSFATYSLRCKHSGNMIAMLIRMYLEGQWRRRVSV